jgi:hypothetical protein
VGRRRGRGRGQKGMNNERRLEYTDGSKSEEKWFQILNVRL